MQIKSIQPVYFSPTHTSAKIVTTIAEGMNIIVNKEIDLTYPSTNQKTLPSDTLAIIGVPTYAGRVAPTALERLQKIKGDNTPAIIVVLYGNRDYEDALLELRNTAKQLGFVPIAGGAFIGEHSYSTEEFPTAAGRPDVSDIQIAAEFGKNIIKQLYQYTDIKKLPVLDVKGNFPYKENKPRTPATPITIDELCTQCQYCIEICPVETIELKEEIVSDPEICIKCCACVKECPNGARVFNTPFSEFLFKNFHDRKEPELFDLTR